MNKPLVKYMVKRYLRFDQDQPFIFLSALLAFLGILLGVMVLIIAMSLMNGFDAEFRKKLTVMNYPLTIMPKFYGSVDKDVYTDLKKEFPDLAFSPYVASPVIVRRGSTMEGGYLFGVDLKAEAKANDVVARAIKDKEYKKFDVIIGKSLKDELYLNDGERLMYIFTQAEPGGLTLAPTIKRFKIQGTFDSGLSAYDKAYHYTSLEAIQLILNLPSSHYDGIHVFSKTPHEDIKRLSAYLPDSVRVKGWWEDNLSFFSALELEKHALFIVLMLIILIAAVNIISSLLMTVMNRRSEIALFISLGASEAEVKKIFLYLGVIIGVTGIIAGTILGLSGLWILSSFDLITIPADVYGTSRLPLKLSIIDFASIIIGAFCIVVLSAWYPAKKAAQVDVLNVLRNE
ncbi:MAG TPA: ABC transporter permease [Sulfurimonas sp.]|nr:ABC transporter permease [Sulfurimonas sp.]